MSCRRMSRLLFSRVAVVRNGAGSSNPGTGHRREAQADLVQIDDEPEQVEMKWPEPEAQDRASCPRRDRRVTPDELRRHPHEAIRHVDRTSALHKRSTQAPQCPQVAVSDDEPLDIDDAREAAAADRDVL